MYTDCTTYIHKSRCTQTAHTNVHKSRCTQTAHTNVHLCRLHDIHTQTFMCTNCMIYTHTQTYMYTGCTAYTRTNVHVHRLHGIHRCVVSWGHRPNGVKFAVSWERELCVAPCVCLCKKGEFALCVAEALMYLCKWVQNCLYVWVRVASEYVVLERVAAVDRLCAFVYYSITCARRTIHSRITEVPYGEHILHYGGRIFTVSEKRYRVFWKIHHIYIHVYPQYTSHNSPRMPIMRCVCIIREIWHTCKCLNFERNLS